MRATEHAPRCPIRFLERRQGLAEIVEREVAAQLFDERFRRSGEEILDLVLSLPSRRRLAATSTPRKAR